VLVAAPASPAAASLREVADQLRRLSAGPGMALPILRG
jgi:putative MATE family efflux protein